MYKFIHSKIPGHYEIDCNGSTYAIHEVSIENDIETLHLWMNYRHVAKFWKLDKPLDELTAHYEKQLADKHQTLYMISKNGEKFAYFEKYALEGDPLSPYVEYNENDFGWHLLIGNPRMVGRGILNDIITAISITLFETENCLRILGEPDIRVKPFIITGVEIGYKWRGTIELGDKRANLFEMAREDFYNTHEVLTC